MNEFITTLSLLQMIANVTEVYLNALKVEFFRYQYMIGWRHFSLTRSNNFKLQVDYSQKYLYK